MTEKETTIPESKKLKLHSEDGTKMPKTLDAAHQSELHDDLRNGFNSKSEEPSPDGKPAEKALATKPAQTSDVNSIKSEELSSTSRALNKNNAQVNQIKAALLENIQKEQEASMKRFEDLKQSIEQHME